MKSLLINLETYLIRSEGNHMFVKIKKIHVQMCRKAILNKFNV